VPRLETPRLVLHPLAVDEASALHAGDALRGFEYAEGYPLPDTHDGVGLFLKHGVVDYGFHLIVRREDGQVIGEIGFVGPPQRRAVTIGYAIVPAARRQGYATEAVVALTAWAIAQPEVDEVKAQTLPDNEPSIRARKRAGYAEEPPLPKVRRFAYRGDSATSSPPSAS
jgi:RimJ/RimL family protein N-acetyltransferase